MPTRKPILGRAAVLVALLASSPALVCADSFGDAAPSAGALVAQAKKQARSVLAVDSTAIRSNIDKSCASKLKESQALIQNVKDPAVRGLITAEPNIASREEDVWSDCASTHFGQVCVPKPCSTDPNEACDPNDIAYCTGGNVCDGGYVTSTVYSCQTILTLSSDLYALRLVEVKTGNLAAQMSAAVAQGNVVYDELDGQGRAARWVVVEKSR